MAATWFEVVADRAVFRMSGTHTLEDGVPQVTAAILQACELGLDKLLVDVTAINLPVPSVGARHWFMTEWARAARGRIVIAMVARPEFIDPDRFGVIAGRNHGLVSNVFESEPAALAWLNGLWEP